MITVATLVTGFLRSLLDDAFAQVSEILLNILDAMLHIESALPGLLTDANLHTVYKFIYGAAVSLVILKFLSKGFQIYILWRDGDTDVSPKDMLLGAAEGVVFMLVFPALYEIAADVTLWFASGIMAGFNIYAVGSGSDASGWQRALDAYITVDNAFAIIMVLVYLILFLALWIKMLKRGWELLVLRLGVPIACLGLIDSDGGLFKGYMQTLLKSLFTAVVQICLMSLSVRIMYGNVSLMNTVMAISAILLSLNTPVLMQQLLAPVGTSAGMLQKASSTAMLANSLRSLFRR